MPISKERLAEIAAIPDRDIDTSDIPEAGENFFRDAALRAIGCARFAAGDLMEFALALYRAECTIARVIADDPRGFVGRCLLRDLAKRLRKAGAQTFAADIETIAGNERAWDDELPRIERQLGEAARIAAGACL